MAACRHMCECPPWSGSFAWLRLGLFESAQGCAGASHVCCCHTRCYLPAPARLVALHDAEDCWYHCYTHCSAGQSTTCQATFWRQPGLAACPPRCLHLHQEAGLRRATPADPGADSSRAQACHGSRRPAPVSATCAVAGAVAGPVAGAVAGSGALPPAAYPGPGLLLVALDQLQRRG